MSRHYSTKDPKPGHGDGHELSTNMDINCGTLHLALAALLLCSSSLLLVFSAQGYSTQNQSQVRTFGSGNVVSSISVVSTIAAGKKPIGVAYDSSNTNLYVPNNSSNTVSVISSSGSTLNTVTITQL